MSVSLSTFRANISSSFDILTPQQFEALYEEVLKENAKRLIGEKALKAVMVWKEVTLGADITVTGNGCAVRNKRYDIAHNDISQEI